MTPPITAGRPVLSLIAHRPLIYICLVLLSATGAAIYGFRQTSLFACRPADDAATKYVGYCQAPRYGDYDYGAFWFDLEPSALRAASDAKVLFLGNSRLQFAFSSKSLDDWFMDRSTSYYLLGFAYDGNYLFAEPLLEKLHPQARVYVVNLDRFFEGGQTPPAKTVMFEPSAEARYRSKRRLQIAHNAVCGKITMLCGAQLAFYRDRETGSWQFRGGDSLVPAPVTYDRSIDRELADAYVASARAFLDNLPVPSECQILTSVPTVASSTETAREIASSLARPFVAPQFDDLQTFDGSHLDEDSANRWSAEFLREAGATIVQCLAKWPGSSGLSTN